MKYPRDAFPSCLKDTQWHLNAHFLRQIIYFAVPPTNHSLQTRLLSPIEPSST